MKIVKDLISDAVGKIGENIVFKRADYLDGNIHTYVHNKIDDGLGKIGVLLKLSSSEKDLSDLGKKLCMHIAAASPLSISEKDLDNKYLEAEKEIIEKQLKDSGKPDNIVEKMLQGKINKIFEEVYSSKGQKFVMDQSLSIGDYLKSVSEEMGETITVDKFIRYELGALKMVKSENKRILLKLSGESLMGSESYGIELEVIDKIANDIKNLKENNIQTCIVIGGGNIFRGLAASAKGMERANADYIGMLATVMNSLGLQNGLEKIIT